MPPIGLDAMLTSTDAVYQLLHTPDGQPPDWNAVLAAMLEAFDCTTGTIHVLDPADHLLHIRAHHGIPEALLPRMSVIPIGKGMAGIAAERRAPVQVCNLQTDDSGVARPSAKETRMEGSLAAPMMEGERLYGVLGIAKPVAYEFSQQEIDAVMRLGEAIGRKMRAAASERAE